jgi:hypothetical protein
MVLFDGFLGILAFGVWIFCIIDVITQPARDIRNLPKLVWLLVVILLVDIGSIAWLVAGRPWKRIAAPQAPRPQPRTPPRAPDDDAEFLAQLRERAEEQRRRAREAPERDDPPQTA